MCRSIKAHLSTKLTRNGSFHIPCKGSNAPYYCLAYAAEGFARSYGPHLFRHAVPSCRYEVSPNQGNILISGRINQHAWFPGTDMADPYLGIFFRHGQKLAEFVFGGWSWRQIVAIHPRRDGGILVTAPNRAFS